ncbi:glycosyltransferase [Brevundimonas sp.]|uniref:glycosyltransferase n=1 Tax=Brevundimonas sp. TaxID=1871086 RepID=UPI003D13AA6D
MPPRIVLATAGSLGDLHPFIALALALKACGFEAEIASSPQHGDKIRAEGLIFHPIGPGIVELEVMMGMTEAEITEAVTRSSTFLFEKMLLPHLESGARQLLAVAGGAVAIVGSTFAAGAAMAADVLGVPFVPVALQPAIVFSAYDPPALPNAPWLAPASGGWRLTLNRMTIAAARASGAGWTKPVDRIRRSLGLAPLGANLLLDGLKDRSLALGLYSPLLSVPQVDAPPGFAVTGYALYDSETGGTTTRSPALEAFLAAGPAPIVFTLGSAAVIVPGSFYVESLKAARRLGRRAVLLVGPKGDAGIADGPDVVAVPYAPYSTLFPRAAAVVHQGGVGTTQQALRAGKPQLIVPFLGDQYDNAARMVRLGCGATLGRRRYRAGRVAEVLSAVLADPTVAETATRLGVVASREDGAKVAAERIADLIRSER